MLSRAESTAGKMEDRRVVRAREGQTYERRGGCCILEGKLQFTLKTQPIQNPVDFTDWPRQALAGQCWQCSAIGCLSWQWLTRAKKNMDNAV